MTQRPLEIFISSPSDVRPERLIAERVVARLAREFAYHFRITPVLWEREPLIATEHFQTMIRPPSQTDIVVVILWSKLGTPLPAEKFRRLDGSEGVTGTEWEFEDAVRAYRESGTPDLLVYKKRTRIATFLDDEGELERQRQQKKQLESFWRRWFEDHEAGGIKAAWHGFDTGEEFEAALELHLRSLIEEKVRTATGGHLAPEEGGGIHWFKGSPFRGLQSFELEHAAVFFGRTRARNRLRELVQARDLKREGFLLVFGASGSGKSSLVKAGLLPDLLLPGMVGRVALVRHAVWTPAQGAAALAAALLAALPELAPLGWNADTLGPLLLDNPDTALVPLRQALADAGRAAQLTEHAEGRLVLVVDQLEELFTGADMTPEAFGRLATALAGSGAAWVIATMRSDFFDRLEGAPALAALAAGEGQYQLLPVEAGEIAEIVRRPAREAGLRFETDAESGIGLDSELIAAASADRAALPLLEFTLDELWQRRSPDGALTFEAYRVLGGLAGALAHRAEEVFAALPADVHRQMPALTRTLVTVSDEGTPTARTARLGELSAARALADALVAARLLVADGDIVRIAHEALIRHWPRLQKQIEEDRADLAIRARLEQAMRRHAARPDASLLLPAGLPLSEAEDLLARQRAELSRDVVAYVELSSAAHRARQRKSRRLLVAATVVFAVLAAGAGLMAVMATNAAHTANRESARAELAARDATTQRNAALTSAAEAERQRAAAEASAAEAVRQRDAAEAQRALVLRQQSLFLVRAAEKEGGEGGLPFLLMREALPADLAQPNRPFVPEAFAALYAVVQKFERPVVFQGDRERSHALAVSRDGRRLVNGSQGTARLYDMETRRPLLAFTGHEGAVTAVAFSPDGREVATGAEDGRVRVFGIDGRELRRFEGRGVPVAQIVWGRALHALGRDGLAVATDGPAFAAPDSTTIRVIAEDPDGRLVAGMADGRLTSLGPQPVALAAHDGPVTGFAVSPDPSVFATAGGDGTAKLWRQGQTIATLRLAKPAAFLSVAFSADGRRLLTTHDDGQARLWSVPEGQLLAAYREDGVGRAALFTPDGRGVVTANDFGLIKVWNAFPDQAALQTYLDMADLLALLIGRDIGPEQRRAFFLPVAAARPEPANACDRLAGHPYDPGRVGPPVFADLIDSRRAASACASAAASGEPRFLFQLARVAERGGDADAAERAYRAAADKGYGIAMTALARVLAREKPDEAAAWKAKAVAAGDPLALYEAGELERALQKGMPLAAFKLGEKAEAADKPAEAVRFHAIGFRLLRDAGIAGEGRGFADRAAALLRRIPPAELAAVWQAVRGWKP